MPSDFPFFPDLSDAIERDDFNRVYQIIKEAGVNTLFQHRFTGRSPKGIITLNANVIHCPLSLAIHLDAKGCINVLVAEPDLDLTRILPCGAAPIHYAFHAAATSSTSPVTWELVNNILTEHLKRGKSIPPDLLTSNNESFAYLAATNPPPKDSPAWQLCFDSTLPDSHFSLEPALELLPPSGSDSTFVRAFAHSQTEFLDTLAIKGIDANTLTSEGNNALIIALRLRYRHVAEDYPVALLLTKEQILQLIEKTTNINLLNPQGLAAIHFAVALKDPDFIHAIASKEGANLELPGSDLIRSGTPFQLTPLEMAVLNVDETNVPAAEAAAQCLLSHNVTPLLNDLLLEKIQKKMNLKMTRFFFMVFAKMAESYEKRIDEAPCHLWDWLSKLHKKPDFVRASTDIISGTLAWLILLKTKTPPKQFQKLSFQNPEENMAFLRRFMASHPHSPFNENRLLEVVNYRILRLPPGTTEDSLQTIYRQQWPAMCGNSVKKNKNKKKKGKKKAATEIDIQTPLHEIEGSATTTGAETHSPAAPLTHCHSLRLFKPAPKEQIIKILQAALLAEKNSSFAFCIPRPETLTSHTSVGNALVSPKRDNTGLVLLNSDAVFVGSLDLDNNPVGQGLKISTGGITFHEVKCGDGSNEITWADEMTCSS